MHALGGIVKIGQQRQHPAVISSYLFLLNFKWIWRQLVDNNTVQHEDLIDLGDLAAREFNETVCVGRPRFSRTHGGRTGDAYIPLGYCFLSTPNSGDLVGVGLHRDHRYNEP